MSRYARLSALMDRLAVRACALPCVRGVPVDRAKATHISRRFRVLKDALMREVRANYMPADLRGGR